MLLDHIIIIYFQSECFQSDVYFLGNYLGTVINSVLDGLLTL